MLDENPTRSTAAVQTANLRGPQNDVTQPPPLLEQQQEKQRNGQHDDTTSSSITFNHMNCHPKDRRLLFREQLLNTQLRNGREVLDFGVIESMVLRKPKFVTFKYIFQYPDGNIDRRKETKTRWKKRSHEVYPLSRILCFCPPLSLVQRMLELHPPALSEADQEGRLPLHFACRFDANLDVIIYIYLPSGQVRAIHLPTNNSRCPAFALCGSESITGRCQVHR